MGRVTLWNLAPEALVSSTTWPLRIWCYLGGICILLAVAYAGLLIGRYGVEVLSSAAVLGVSLFFNGMILISLGVIGEYVGGSSGETPPAGSGGANLRP